MKKYTYDEIQFVVREVSKTYKEIINKKMKSKFPIEYKREIYKKFIDHFGHSHPFTSIKLLIDNILANWSISGYTKFGKGSSLVQEIAGNFEI